METSILAKWISRQHRELHQELDEETKQLSRQQDKLAQMKNAKLTVHEILNNIMQEENHVPTRKFMPTRHEDVNNKMHCVRDDGRVETIVKVTHKKKIKTRHEDHNGQNDRFLMHSFCCW